MGSRKRLKLVLKFVGCRVNKVCQTGIPVPYSERSEVIKRFDGFSWSSKKSKGDEVPRGTW